MSINIPYLGLLILDTPHKQALINKYKTIDLTNPPPFTDQEQELFNTMVAPLFLTNYLSASNSKIKNWYQTNVLVLLKYYSDQQFEDIVNKKMSRKEYLQELNLISDDNINLLLNSFPVNFPYRRQFFAPASILFQSLKDLPINITRDRFFWLRGEQVKINKFNSTYLYIMASSNEDIDQITDHYLEEIRLLTHRKDSRPLLDYWTDDKLKRKVAEDYLVKYGTYINYRQLRDVLYYQTFEAKSFRPSWARGILYLLLKRSDIWNRKRTSDAINKTITLKGRTTEYQQFLPVVKENLHFKVLDMSAGWGDRLIAAMSLGMEYTGYDPNINLRDAHSQMIKDFGDINKHRVIYLPFEKASLEDNTFDIMLTSPPYFNIEIYPDENGQQSIYNYPQYEQWLKEFLFVSINKSWKAIKKGGFLAIHLADVKDEPKLVQPLLDNNRKYGTFLGCLGLTSNVDDNKIPKCWPVWVWQKK